MKALPKKMLRTVYKNRGQSIAVSLVVLCGTACYICLASLHRDLLLTRDTYYSQYRFADFEIMMERAPSTVLFKLQEIPGVRQVRTRIVEEVNLDVEGVTESRVGRIISMPNTPRPVLNDVLVKSGRYFEPGAHDEVLLSEAFAIANHLEIGDTIKITVDGRKHALRIVGLGLSPEYVYVIRNIQELVPSPERFAILWVPEEFAENALSMEGACNNIIGSIDDPEQVEAILDRMEDVLDAYGIFAKVKSEDQLSNRFVSDEIKGLGVSARIIPTVFLGISALVILILLNRMVRNERTQIGLMKAYGYSDWAVGIHYLQFALILAGAGCLAAFFVGQWLALQMMKVYVSYYQFPILRSQIYPDILVRAMGITAFFAVSGAMLAAWRAGKIHPAESMRPESPRVGRRIWLETITVIWERLSFTWKMIARNVSRSRFRSGLNVFGVMVSAGLLIVGYFALDAIEYMLDFQYEITRRDDLKANFIVERDKQALYEAQRLDHVRHAEALLQYPFEMRNGWRKKDAIIFGLERGAELQRLIDAQERVVDIGNDGLVLSEILATSLGVEVGDPVTLKPLMGRVTEEKVVRVSKVVKQYFGASAYMNIEALSRVLDEAYALNAVLLRTDPGAEHLVNAALKDIPAVAAVEVKADSLKSLTDTLGKSMSIMSGVIVVFAGVISFAIIYNVTTVSLSERQRELASLRVLGFTKQEVGGILYYENFITGAIGIALGMPFGMLICLGMVNAYDTDLYRFPFHIEPRTFVISIVCSILFITIANLAVRHKIHNLDLVEVLKARE